MRNKNKSDFKNVLTPDRKIKAENVLFKLLILLGKPFFILIFYFLAFLSSIPQSIEYLTNKIKVIKKNINVFPWLFSNFPKKRLGEKGVIFSSKNLNFKLFFKRAKKISTNTFQKFKDFIWNLDVFLLAVKKLIRRFVYKTKVISNVFAVLAFPFRFLKILFFKLEIVFFRLKSKLPTRKFPRKTSERKIVIIALLSCFFVLILILTWFWYFILRDLPSPQVLADRVPQTSTKIYDRDGILLYTIYKDQNRTIVPLSSIPAQIRSATIAAEDSEFYSHPGFSIKGITRALYINLREKKLTGGSTITQQLVKNAILGSEKTYIRKIKEVVLAIQVELTYSKDQILEMYLNEVPYGGTAYGIQEASRMYFGKDVGNLTLAESALLAGLPQSPTSYSPFGSHPERALERKDEILSEMREHGFITESQEENAKNEVIRFSDTKIPIKAPHFVFYVREILEEEYGKDKLEQGGMKIVTSLDFNIQKLTKDIVSEEIEKLKKLNATNAAVIVMNPKTGEILAMVGSHNFFDTVGGGNVNVTTRLRQPGSSIKIVNYAYALSHSFTAATIIPDIPATFLIEGQEPYTPKNYEGGFRGNLTLRSALAESRNIPAVRVLASYGVENMLIEGQNLGITTWENEWDYGLSLTLGGGEVKLIDLARVYSTVANYGVRPDINPILKVTDVKNDTLEEFNCNDESQINLVQDSDGFIESAIATTSSLIASKNNNNDCNFPQVLDPRVTYVLTDILKDNEARSPSFGPNSLLNITNHPEVAVKTGTSNNLRDNLAIGYNQDYVVAVWVGNNDNSEMDRIASGITGATPIFNSIMTALLADSESKSWEIPDGLVQLPICPYTGTLACEGCPVKNEWFLKENKPELTCKKEWFSTEAIETKDGGLEEEPTPDINNSYFEHMLREQKNIQKKEE